MNESEITQEINRLRQEIDSLRAKLDEMADDVEDPVGLDIRAGGGVDIKQSGNVVVVSAAKEKPPMPFDIRLCEVGFQVWMPGANDNLVKRNGYSVAPPGVFQSAQGWVSYYVSMANDQLVYLEIIKTDNTTPDYPPNSEDNTWTLTCVPVTTPLPVELRTPVLIAAIISGKVIQIRNGSIDTYAYPPDSISVFEGGTAFHSLMFLDDGRIELGNFSELWNDSISIMEDAAHCDVVLRYQDSNSGLIEIRYIALGDIITGVVEQLKEDPSWNDPDPDPYDLLSRNCDLDSNGFYVYDPCLEGIEGTGHGGFVKKNFWEAGAGITKNYGSAIGDSTKAEVIDLDAKELDGDWACTGELSCETLAVDGKVYTYHTIEVVTDVDFVNQTVTKQTFAYLGTDVV